MRPSLGAVAGSTLGRERERRGGDLLVDEGSRVWFVNFRLSEREAHTDREERCATRCPVI